MVNNQAFSGFMARETPIMQGKKQIGIKIQAVV